MGAQMVYVLEYEGNPFAAIYYQWNGYTYPALTGAKDLIDVWDSYFYDDTLRNRLRGIIRYLESNGGGIAEILGFDERAYIERLYPDTNFITSGYNRGSGVIAVSGCGIKQLIEDARCNQVIIDFSNRIVTSFVYRSWTSEQEVMEAYPTIGEKELYWAPQLPADPGNCPFSRLDALIRTFGDYRYSLFRYNNIFIELIGV